MSTWLNPRDFESAGSGSPRTGAGTKPKIEVDELDLLRLREQAWAALSAVNDPPHLFRCGERLVRVVQDGDDGVRAEELTRDRLRAVLTLVQACLRAGQPRWNLPFASFESWAAVMSGIRAAAGVEGF